MAVRSRPLATGQRIFGPAALLVVAVVIHLPTLSQPLLEAHAFRQTQTAYTTLMFARDGIDLLRPPLPSWGPLGLCHSSFHCSRRQPRSL